MLSMAKKKPGATNHNIFESVGNEKKNQILVTVSIGDVWYL